MRPSHALATLACVLACAAITARVDAYDPSVTLLARALVAEAGPRLNADHAAVLHVLERRASRRGERIDETARSYCQVFRGPVSDLGRAIEHATLLELSGRAPGVVELAIGWQRGQRPRDPCPGSMHFGQAHGRDLERATRAGWHRITCSKPTEMAYWSDL